MGRLDTADPGDVTVPMFQFLALADLNSRIVKIKPIEEGLSFLNNEEMDPYQKYVLIEGDEISFSPGHHRYILRFIEYYKLSSIIM